MFPRFMITATLGLALSVTLAGGVMAQSAAQQAAALDAQAQTPAGVGVENTISLTYNGAQGVTVTLPETDLMTATFTVARKIDLTVSAETAEGLRTVSPGQNGIELDFTVQNLGNDIQGFDIDVLRSGNIPNSSNALTGLAYSPTVTAAAGTYYVLVNDSIYDAEGIVNAADLLPGELLTVTIVANVPAVATDTLTDLFTVTATALNRNSVQIVEEDRDNAIDSDTENVVFADVESISIIAAVGVINPALDGKAANETRLTVSAPVLTATKTVTVLDENLPGSTFNCADAPAPVTGTFAAIPGACVEYTITVTNAGDATQTAANVVITDTMPQDVTFVGTGQGDFTTVTNDNAAEVTVTGTLETLPAGQSASFTIRATIN